MEVSGQHVPSALPQGKNSVSTEYAVRCSAGPTVGMEILDTKYVVPARTRTQLLAYSLH